MKHTLKTAVWVLFVCAFFLCPGRPALAVTPGQVAPAFALADLSGKEHSLEQARHIPMLVLYFFDAASRPSQEGLLVMDEAAKKYKGARLEVWGIAISGKAQAQEFASRVKPAFPILVDTKGDVCEAYGARAILPTACIIGPDRKVLDVFQGGGRFLGVMLTRVAERKLQQKDTVTATAVSELVAKKEPDNAKAASVRGYAALKDGRLAEAEKIFAALARGSGMSAIMGKEGLAAVYARQGKTDKALALADELVRTAPDRAYAHVIKADILYAQNRRDDARKEFESATKKKDAEIYQRAVAYNKLGRLYASVKDYKTSQRLYERAVELDPYYVEAMANNGLALEKQGKWDKALEVYRKGQAVNQQDDYTRVLAARALEMLEYQKDQARRQRIDALVKELSQRFKEQRNKPVPEDTWTSPPMVIGFVDFQEQGGLAERDGMSVVLTAQLADHLKASGRVKVVDRVLLERLLEELNLGSSELADPETSLRLGRVLAARLLATGTILNVAGGSIVNMRLVDTETTSVAKVINHQTPGDVIGPQDVFGLNRQILQAVVEAYPLRAYVVEVRRDEVMINIGSDQGVVRGTRFDVVEEAEPVEYKGRKLKAAPKVVGELEVVRVEPGLAWCRIVSASRGLGRDDKIVEKAAHAVPTT